MNSTDPAAPDREPNLDASFSVSLAEGIQCVFDVGEHTISVWGSAWSGREVVRVDGVVVSDVRNLTRFSARHDFTLDGEPYHLILRTEAFLRGQYAAYLYHNDHLIDSDSGCYKMFRGNGWSGWRGLCLWIVLWFGGGLLCGFFGVLAYSWLFGGNP